jgi:hypothetical protein
MEYQNIHRNIARATQNTVGAYRYPREDLYLDTCFVHDTSQKIGSESARNEGVGTWELGTWNSSIIPRISTSKRCAAHVPLAATRGLIEPIASYTHTFRQPINHFPQPSNSFAMQLHLYVGWRLWLRSIPYSIHFGSRPVFVWVHYLGMSYAIRSARLVFQRNESALKHGRLGFPSSVPGTMAYPTAGVAPSSTILPLATPVHLVCSLPKQVVTNPFCCTVWP